jgi:DNA-binding transcriptional LysR family regulator
VYLEQHGRPSSVAELGRHALVAFEGAMEDHRANVWLKSALPEARIVARNASVLGVLATVRAGVGIGALPTAVAADETALEAVLPLVPELTRGWYLLTRPDLRAVPHISAFFEFMVAESQALRAALSG